MNPPFVSSADFGVDNQNPWLGLASFTEELSSYFHGRENETAELFRLLKRETLTVFFGQSGLGKTSMLQAGLFPQLRQADFLPVHIRLMHASDAPKLADQVKAALVKRIEASEVDAPKPDQSETLWEYFHRKDVDFWNAKQRLTTPVLVFDQFEEIFTLGQADDARRSQSGGFLTELADLIENRPPALLKEKLDRGDGEAERFFFDQESCKVILTLREDFLPDLEGLRPLMRSITQNRMRIMRMNGTQAHQAVDKPGQGLLEEGVATRIVEFVAGAKNEGALSLSSTETLAGLQVEPALLSVVCRELNAKRQKLRLPKITPDLLEGNRGEIIAEFYERSISDLPLAARLFVENRLLTKSGYRVNVPLETALADGVALDTIYQLVNRRLLRLEDRFGVPLVELTHDVLTGVIRASRDARQQRDAAERLIQERRARARKRLAAFSVAAVVLLIAFSVGGYLYLQWCKRWGNWTPVMSVDFSQAPPERAAQIDWLKERFSFRNREATADATPWLVQNGALVMLPHEWCWLRFNDVSLRDDTKVVVDLRFAGGTEAGGPEAFQICINAKEKLRQWDNNPPGYSCRFGIWQGSTDLITRNEFDRENDFNSLLVSSAPQIFASPHQESKAPAGGVRSRDFSLTFLRQGETVVLQVDGHEQHRDTYLLPLLGEQAAAGGDSGYYEKIGIRTWDKNTEILRVSAYRFKLPEMASPIVAADALVESGNLTEAVEKYKTIAKDYQQISSSISARALANGYLLADHLEDKPSRDWCYQNLTKLEEHALSHSLASWLHPSQSAECLQYADRIREAEALRLWKQKDYQHALPMFPVIFKANPKTRIVMECLQTEHLPLEAIVRQQLLERIAETLKRTPDLAGLDISSFDMTDLSALAALHPPQGQDSLRNLDCRNNKLTTLDPLRRMDQLRALDCSENQISNLDPLRNMKNLQSLCCGHNQITTLDPIRSLPIGALYCDGNHLETLEPLTNMPLYSLYCSGNRIRDLSPLKGMPIYALDCSGNEISSLDPILDLPQLLELYCGSNHLRSLDPLRSAKSLHYLDCSSNGIQTLEPLKDLDLERLDCSGNPIATLEPFVDEQKNPPKIFTFDDCETLSAAEIRRAIDIWKKKGLQSNVSYATFALARKQGDAQVKELAQRDNGHGYLFVQKNLNRGAAEDFCKRLGGHLVTITSKAENDFLKKITPEDASYRIGMKFSEDRKPLWVNGDGVDLTFLSTLTDFRPSDAVMTWKNGSWLPLSLKEDRPMSFIIEWDP
jgi:hypothetical protein